MVTLPLYSARKVLARLRWPAAIACLTMLLFSCGTPAKSGGGSNECIRGSAGCACGPEKACDDGLLCDDGTCHGEATVGLSISDPNARACEVLLVEKGAHVLRVDYGTEVVGTHVREAPRTALSFISKSDASIPDGAVQVRFAEGMGDPPEVSVVNCSDNQGAPLQGVKVTFRG